ncbi:hypothetical protein [Thiolapillus sp.]|uniref:hypothetical protein n=2 Tax=Thiolapillus sp. TaxID=2017437 RepID=UPI003AF447B5
MSNTRLTHSQLRVLLALFSCRDAIGNLVPTGARDITNICHLKLRPTRKALSDLIDMKWVVIAHQDTKNPLFLPTAQMLPSATDDASDNLTLPLENVENEPPPRNTASPKATSIDLSAFEGWPISQDTIKRFIAHRKVKKSPLTQYALELNLKAALRGQEEIGMTADEVLLFTIKEGWQGVNLKWIDNRRRGNPKGRTRPRAAEIAKKAAEKRARIMLRNKQHQ